MQQIRATVATEFEQVNQLIVDQLHSDVPMVENVGHYIVDAGGKLCVIGPLATHDKWMQPRSKPALDDLLAERLA